MKKGDRVVTSLRSASSMAVTASPQVVSRFPLAALPSGMLMRSLLIAGISSKRVLLMPSLKVLSFLSKPRRGFLFNVDRNPVIHGILKRTFYNQFCAGETGLETRQCVRRLKDLGFKGVILTFARETIFDHQSKATDAQDDNMKRTLSSSEPIFCPHIEDWRTGTLKTAELVDEGDFLAIKLTGAGPLVTGSFASGLSVPQQFLNALNEICAVCKARSIRIIVDAESQHVQKGIDTVAVELMRQFNRDGTAVIYNTYQAYLKQTANVIDKHLELAQQDQFTLGLKLVRGAYILSEDRSLIHDTKQETDNAYDRIATGALKRQIGEFGVNDSKPFPSVNLFLASHNRSSLIGAHNLHQERLRNGLPTIPVGYGQLHGMSDEVSFSLLSQKDEHQTSPDVFKCSTWGSMGECLAYLLRRAVENRDAVMRTSDEYAALKSEAWRRIKSGVIFFG